MKINKFYFDIFLIVITTVISIQPNFAALYKGFLGVTSLLNEYLFQVYTVYPFLYPWLTLAIFIFLIWFIVSVTFKVLEN
jgi:hypothetical protein